MALAIRTTHPQFTSSPAHALALMVAAQLFFSLMTYFIKWAHTLESLHSQSLGLNSMPFGTWESVLFRCFPMMVMSIVIHLRRTRSRVQHPKLDRKNIQWLLIRGVVGATSMACFFHGTLTIPLGLASFFVNSSVFLIGILGHVFLREKMTLTRSLFALSGLSGVALILTSTINFDSVALSPNFNDHVISFLAGVLSAFAYFSLRKMPSIPGNTIVFSLSASGVALSVVAFSLFIPLRLPESRAALCLLMASSIPAIFAQFLMTRAFKTGEAGFVALGQYAGPVFSTLIGYFAFSEILTPLQWLGALIAFLFGVLLPFVEANTLALQPLRTSAATLRDLKERIRLP
jgi:drug/metabolite transporter (DMT)-like permease